MRWRKGRRSSNLEDRRSQTGGRRGRSIGLGGFFVLLVRQAQGARRGQANQLSVLMELQADCFAGVWGHSDCTTGNSRKRRRRRRSQRRGGDR